MRKILFGILVLTLLAPFGFAAKLNLEKVGTPWVMRVEDGLSLHFILLESEDRALFENGDLVRGEETSSEGLYNALLGQGWTITDSPVTVPQALTVADVGLIELDGFDGFTLLETGNFIRREASEPSTAASALDFGLMEDSTLISFENDNTLRLEN